MFGNLGAGEIVILMLIVLLVFGAGRLPEAGKAVGKGLRGFNGASPEARTTTHRSPQRGAAGLPKAGRAGARELRSSSVPSRTPRTASTGSPTRSRRGTRSRNV